MGRRLAFNERASEILDHIIAGQDPVPAALEFIVKQLSIHEDIQSCLHAELLGSIDLLAKGHGSATVDNSAYLDCIVMESLRLIDNISSYQTRIVPPGGCLILGCFLPGGVSNNSFFLGSSHLSLPTMMLIRYNHLDSRIRTALPHQPPS